MVAPQGLDEMSYDPKYKRFTVIKQMKNRNAKPFIIKFNYKDENIPYVKKVNKKLVIGNYKPSSLFTARRTNNFRQSKMFVDKKKKKILKSGFQKNRKQQTKNMRNKQSHKIELNALMDKCIQENSKQRICFKCGRQTLIDKVYHKKLQQKIKYVKDFYSYLRQSHKGECLNQQITLLTMLICHQRDVLRQEYDKLLQSKDHINKIKILLDEI